MFHAYQLLRAGGYRADHIVVMAADDIAHDPQNPLPGKVFNRPGGLGGLQFSWGCSFSLVRLGRSHDPLEAPAQTCNLR